MLNRVMLQGRLCADPELKTTPSGVYVTSVNIACDRPAKSGEEHQADFISIVAWRSTAEFLCNWFRKGALILVEGRLQTRQWKDRDGNNRTAYEVVVDQAHFCEGRKRGEENHPSEETPAPVTNSEAVSVTITDEELPF